MSPISSERIATKDKTIILAIAMQIISGILLRQFPEDVLDLPDYQMITKEIFMTDFLRVVEKVQVHIVRFKWSHTKQIITSKVFSKFIQTAKRYLF